MENRNLRMAMNFIPSLYQWNWYAMNGLRGCRHTEPLIPWSNQLRWFWDDWWPWMVTSDCRLPCLFTTRAKQVLLSCICVWHNLKSREERSRNTPSEKDKSFLSYGSWLRSNCYTRKGYSSTDIQKATLNDTLCAYQIILSFSFLNLLNK